MRIDVLTLFPEMFQSVLESAIFRRAEEREQTRIVVRNIRDYTHDKHHIVDDYPYGGGAGMVLKPEPVFEAVEDVISEITAEDETVEKVNIPVILMTPQGRPFSQKIAQEYSRVRNIILICGHYEGVDERVRQYLATDEISIGDYVLSGGETAAMVMMDAVIRLIPGVLGSEESHLEESHTAGLLEYPQYTRPPVFRGWEVPEILLSGHHGKIAEWRREQSISRTVDRRPDLLNKAELTEDEKRIAQGLHKTL